MTDVISAFNFVRSHGLNHRQFKAFLDEIEVNMVTLYTTIKFIGFTNVRFCNVLCCSYKRPRFSLLKKDNQSVTLKRQDEYVIWSS